ncbi:hypothetical protein [Tepidibacillus marianensis]|uniref:hypothetical protein n=1 Tax=Tepidibacillus marianensis TaxID=3131995 RepID=UPI0030CD37BD
MMTGVAACLIDYTRHFTLEGYDYAVIEVDEASLPKVIRHLKPNSLVITNFFRDQLDRFGEIDMLIQHLKNAVTDPSILLYLNTDDSFVARFNELKNKKIFLESIKMLIHLKIFPWLNRNTVQAVEKSLNMNIYILVMPGIIIVHVDLKEKDLIIRLIRS